MSIVRSTRAVFAIVSLFALSACSIFSSEYPDKQVGNDTAPKWEDQRAGGSLFGPDGLFGSSKKADPQGNGIGINSYLWRASLDTLSFMPLSSADPYGGVIITDWFAPPESPNERFKMSVYITDRELRADGIRVSVFRQTKNGTAWVDATVTSKTPADLENAILTRARELRAANTAIKKG